MEIIHFGFASSLALLKYLQTYMSEANHMLVEKSDELLNVGKKFFNVNMDSVKLHMIDFDCFFDKFKGLFT